MSKPNIKFNPKIWNLIKFNPNIWNLIKFNPNIWNLIKFNLSYPNTCVSKLNNLVQTVYCLDKFRYSKKRIFQITMYTLNNNTYYTGQIHFSNINNIWFMPPSVRVRPIYTIKVFHKKFGQSF